MHRTVCLAFAAILVCAACDNEETRDQSCAGCGAATGTSSTSSNGTGGAGGTSSSSGSGGDGGFIATGGMPPFPPGNIYVAGSRNAQVFEFDSKLQQISAWTHPSFGVVLPAPGQIYSDGPAGMVFDANGHLVVAALDQFCVFSAPSAVLACHPKVKSQPTENIIFDFDGNLYTTTATGGTDEIHKYDSQYNYVTTFTMPTGNLTGVTCDTDGNLFIASQTGATSSIYKVDKTNLKVLDTITLMGSLEGLQLAGDGNILASVDAGGGVLRVEPKSPAVVVGTITHASLFWTVPLTIDNAGNIYTADYENGTGAAPADLFVFDAQGALIASALPSNIYGPFGMVVAGAVLPCGAFQPPK